MSIRLLFFVCILSNSIFSMQKDIAKFPMEPSWQGIPSDVRKIIQSYLLSSIVDDNLEQTVKNITNFARIHSSFRNFLNDPKNLMYVIQMIADRIKRMDENSVAQGLKNMPGIQNAEVKQWLEQRNKERERDGKLIVAIQEEANGETIRKILVSGANPDYKSIGHKEPVLVLAAQMNNLEAVKELLKAGANVNNTDLKLRTALDWATTNQNLEILKELIKYNANVNAQDKNGDTSLMSLVAAITWEHESNLAIINELLNAGADLNIRNKKGKTALDLAHNAEIIRLLKEKMK